MPAVQFATEPLRQFIERDATLSAAAEHAAENVVCTIATRTISGKQTQLARGRIDNENYRDFQLAPSAADSAAGYLEKLGFRILSVGRFGITVAAPADLFREVLKTPIAIHAVPRRVAATSEPRMLSWSPDPPRPEQLFGSPATGVSVPARSVNDAFDHFVFIPPPIYTAGIASALAPRYWHLSLEQVRALLNASSVAQTGSGVSVAMIDSGFYLDHPHFAGRTFFRVSVDSGPLDTDEVGHGTMVFANALAIAPAADYTLLKFSPAVAAAALDSALAHNPKILSCSWGWPNEQTFPTIHATIKAAVLDDGVTMLFATGNGDACWPSTMPEAIAVGGVYSDSAGKLSASSFASGFASNEYPARTVPDVSGLVGPFPLGVYIVLPTAPGSEVDTNFSGGTYPDRDESAANDGWVVASGTSSATPQIAGIAALLLEKNPALKPEDIKRILTQSATPVQTGTNAMGVVAVGHPNTAVGYGLANAAAALAVA